MILLHFKVNQTQNILGERQGKINSNIDEVNIEKIIISQATPIHCSNQGRKVQTSKYDTSYGNFIEGYCKIVPLNNSFSNNLAG